MPRFQITKQADVERFQITKQPETKKPFLEKAKEAVSGFDPSAALETVKGIGRVYPAAETAAHWASMTYGLPAVGIAGLAGLPFGKSEEAMEATGKALIYEPQTQRGRELAETSFYPFTKLEEWGEKAGTKVYEKTGVPELGALTKTAIQAAPLILLAGKFARKGKGKPTRTAKEPIIETPETAQLQKEFGERFIVEKEPLEPYRLIKRQENVSQVQKFKDEPVMSKVVDYKAEVAALKKKKESEARIQRAYEKADELGWTKEKSAEVIPEDLKPAFEVMKEQVSQGGVEKGAGFDRASLYPEWFRNRKLSKKDFDSVMEKVEAGEMLTDRQIAIYEDLLSAADEVKRTHPDFIGESEGFTLFGGLPIHKMGEAYTKVIGTPAWDAMIFEKLPKLIEKIPGVKKGFEFIKDKPPVSTVKKMMIYEYRKDLPNTDKYISSLMDQKRAETIGRELAVDLGNRLQSFSEESQLKMGEHIKGETVSLNPKELKIAEEAKWMMEHLGKQAVDVGLLSEEVFFKNAGRYMPRLYTSKEYQALLNQWSLTKPNRLDLSRFKKRKDIPKEIRQEMGEILTPGYPVAKGITQLTHDISLAKHFKGIAENPDWAFTKGGEGSIPGGFKQLPSNKKLGALSEAYVHPEIFADINESIRVPGVSEKVWRRALGAWKYGKVIISPKTHARNLMSNSVFAHLGGFPMYEQPIYLRKAVKAMRSKGKYWTAARDEGLMSSTFTQGELRALFDQVEGHMIGIKAESIPEKLGFIGESWKKIKGKPAKLYEAEEQWFKMAKFIHNIERGKMNLKAAAADAEKWLFNYSKVTKFQEKYRSKWYGAPFATFTFKALPRIAEAVVKTPWRFALPGAIIYQLEQAAMDMIGDKPEEFKAKKKMRPEWMQGHFLGIPNFARVPIIDDHGREYYFNLTYTLPWGDIAESGGFGPIPGGLMPMSQPFVKEPMQQILNYDSFWKEEIVKETDVAGLKGIPKLSKEAKIRGRHLAQTMLPTPLLDIEKTYDVLKGKPDYRGRERPLGVVLADVLTGVKMYPVSYIDQMQRAVSKLHPEKGYLARKIMSQIRTLSIKKAAIEAKGKSTKSYEDQIKDKVDQLRGLAEELTETGKTFEQTGIKP